MFTSVRISIAQNECGFFIEGFLERSDLSVHMGANGAIVQSE